MIPRRLWVTLLLVVPLACEEDTSAPADPAPEYFTLTLDASASWAYASLSQEASVTVADPATSTEWDIAFYATGVMLNGGAAGPGGSEGHCLCQNAGASDAQILAMTSDGELGDFTAPSAADLPPDPADWSTDALDPAIAGWWSYNPMTHVVSADPTTVFTMKLRGTAYAKFHVTDVQNATMAHAGTVTLEFAVQPTDTDPFGPAATLDVDVSTGPVFVDLVDEAIGAADDWDVQLAGYDIRVNGGVSGSGGVGALLSTEDFASLTTAGDIPPNVYATAGDAFAGVFAAHPWYKYNLDGNHLISPTFDVYLIRRGTNAWKVQVTSYYSATGTSRHISFRAEALQ